MLTPKQVELLFEDRVKLNGGLPIRFQDTKDANGSYLRTNPSDFVCVYPNGSVYSEVKSFKGVRFPFSNIKPSQFAWAAQIHRLGQPYMFYLFQKETETWYLIPAFVILNQAKEGIKSISLTDLEKYKND
jgi:penicillin-binding protein-related factor A (putative recombinase)